MQAPLIKSASASKSYSAPRPKVYKSQQEESSCCCLFSWFGSSKEEQAPEYDESGLSSTPYQSLSSSSGSSVTTGSTSQSLTPKASGEQPQSCYMYSPQSPSVEAGTVFTVHTSARRLSFEESDSPISPLRVPDLPINFNEESASPSCVYRSPSVASSLASCDNNGALSVDPLDELRDLCEDFRDNYENYKNYFANKVSTPGNSIPPSPNTSGASDASAGSGGIAISQEDRLQQYEADMKECVESLIESGHLSQSDAANSFDENYKKILEIMLSL